MRILAGLLPPPAPDGQIGRVAWQGSVGLLDERHALDPGQPLGRALDFWARMDGALEPQELAGLADLI
jgi:heme exporter protein A